MDLSLQPVYEYAAGFFHTRFYHKIADKLKKDLEEGKEIYPVDPFRAFRMTRLKDVKVVILGQDPYHDGKADGLAFSINHNKNLQECSLTRIFNEYCDDLGYSYPKSYQLDEWAERGVLLLNVCLTVEKGKPNSHRNYGWNWLIVNAIKRISEKKDKVVFILWGKEAGGYSKYIDQEKHLVLAHCHPSPLTGKKWYGNKHFSKACAYLNLQHEFWKLR